MTPTVAATAPAVPTAVRIFVLTPRSPHQELVRSAVDGAAVGRTAMAGAPGAGVEGWTTPLKGGQRGPCSGADGAVDVEREQQVAVELVGTADQLAGGAVEGVRRSLEVPDVDVDDVGDAVDQQADGLAVQPDDDDDGLGARRPGRAAEALAQLDRGDDLATQVDQAGDRRRRQRHPGDALAAQDLLHVLDLHAVEVTVQPERGQLAGGRDG